MLVLQFFCIYWINLFVYIEYYLKNKSLLNCKNIQRFINERWVFFMNHLIYFRQTAFLITYLYIKSPDISQCDFFLMIIHQLSKRLNKRYSSNNRFSIYRRIVFELIHVLIASELNVRRSRFEPASTLAIS